MNLKLRQAIPGRPLGHSNCPLASIYAGGVRFVSSSRVRAYPSRFCWTFERMLRSLGEASD